MTPTSAGIDLSASDLSRFLGCSHRTGLDLAVALGQLKAPTRVDPALKLLQERGLAHEKAYVERISGNGVRTVDLSERFGADAVARTREAMEAGLDLVIQAALRNGNWFGRPDVLRRVESPSALGPWSYIAEDTKLARETRGATILQLTLYSDLLRIAQGLAPEHFSVITPASEQPEPYRFNDFAAYFRLIRSQLEESIPAGPESIQTSNYPDKVADCDVCRWWNRCDGRRRLDDHLSLVAGISRLQIRELQSRAIGTLEALAQLALPIPFKPKRGAVESYERVREQARIQLQGRREGRPVHELLAVTPEHGFLLLPEPSPGDIFLDLEGDPFVGLTGREYLFGIVTEGSDGTLRYEADWALSEADERAAFEKTVDGIIEAWERHPGMHVYHYAPYEPSTFKRLMGRYASREAQIDRMLRGGLFIDLHAVVRRALRASVEEYSIKKLEAFYGFEREIALEDAGSARRVVERALELEEASSVGEADRRAVEAYNRDDCVSALRLRDWLESLRAEMESAGASLPRPAPKTAEPTEQVSERERRERELSGCLLAGVPEDPATRTAGQQARWLLAQLLGWHRREENVTWWEYFRLIELTDEELLDEKNAIGGLRFVERLEVKVGCPIDRYTYPFQDTDIRKGDELKAQDDLKVGKVAAIDYGHRLIDIKKTKKSAEIHPPAVFEFEMFRGFPMEESLARLARDIIDHGGGRGRIGHEAGKQLLLAHPPRLRHGEPFTAAAGELATDFAVRIGPLLDQSVLAIQGPPGSGKTYTGAAMIAKLVAEGKRVGVCAVSHKVIRNLLREIGKLPPKNRAGIQTIHRLNESFDEQCEVEECDSNDAALDRVQENHRNVVGGTTFLWSRPEFHDVLDLLVVDEAGQMSLANVLAISQAARSIVLAGDPRQLEQPQKGSHPDGAGISALDHMLAGRRTISADRGIFMPQTRRLAPKICDFTSEVFYQGRLEPMPGLDQQALAGARGFEGSGLWLVPVAHDANSSSSPEEAEAVERIVTRLLAEGSTWQNSKGAVARLTARDILVVAPCSAQVALLEEKLATRGIRVGTVDRFQGQEAPVVIYSTATSTPADAPRGMDFLYSLSRLNVATSRARCASILVANPFLLTPECRTPHQMRLANALCRYVELARTADVA